MNKLALLGAAGAGIIAIAVGVTYFQSPDGETEEATNAATRQAAPPSNPANTGASSAKSGSKTATGQGTQSLRDGGTSGPAAEMAVKPADRSPRFDIVRVNPGGDMVIAGTAAPNALIVVSDRGREIGRVHADKNGDWVLLPSTPLKPGDHELTVASLADPDKPDMRRLSERKVVVVVPEAGTDIAGRPSAGQTGALALSVPRNGEGGSVVLQKPGPGGPPVPSSVNPAAGGKAPTGGKPGPLSLDTVDYNEKGKVEIGGRAPKGAQVQLYLDNKTVGGATADEQGNWRVKPDTPVPPGLYKMRVDQVGSGGKVLARVESPFSRAGPIGNLPPDSVVFVQPGNSLWRIARKTYGEGTTFTVIYEANRDQIRDPDLIYPGQIFVLPKARRSAG